MVEYYRIMALDYGDVRIGIALSDLTRTIANGYENYTRVNDGKDVEHIADIAKANNVKLVVFGLPYNMDGTASNQTIKTQNFANMFAERTGLEIKFLDEHPEYAIVSTTMHHFDEMGIFRTGMASGEPKPSDYPKGVPFNHAPCMIRTSAYKTVGGYSVSGKLLRQEDYHLWLKMYEKGFRGYMLNEPLYNMRDDRNAYARRNWISRRNEAYVKYLACKMLNLPFWYYMYCLKPIILYIMPQWLYKRLHNR